MGDLDCAIPLNNVVAPWFEDIEHIGVFSGFDYDCRCICLIGKIDSDLVLLRDTRNPRRCLWKLQRSSDDRLIVKTAVWARTKFSSQVLAEALRILNLAQTPKDDWFVVPPAFRLPLLRTAASNAGVAVATQAEFVDAVKRHKTERLRSYLMLGGVDAETVQAHRYV